MNKNTPKYIVVHHTGGLDADPLFDSSDRTFSQIDTAHRQDPNVNLGRPSSLGYYIGYHYYIDKNGILTQGRADTDEGAHCRGYNLLSLGICLAGNFDRTLPTDAQVLALRKLLGQKSTQYSIPLTNIQPHRHFASKTCYGNKLADSWAVDLLKVQAIPAPCTSERETIAEQAAQLGKWRAFLAALKALVNNF